MTRSQHLEEDYASDIEEGGFIVNDPDRKKRNGRSRRKLAQQTKTYKEESDEDVIEVVPNGSSKKKAGSWTA